jgi:hypothetical protein
MQTGKSKSKQKTREPYGKVTEVGQVPVALQELRERTDSALENIKYVELTKAQESLVIVRKLADSIIAVTCANPGCLSQMAEESKPSETPFTDHLHSVLKPNIDIALASFICAGCQTVIKIDESIPARRAFVWTEQKTGKKNSYCIDCDDKLIQGIDLPNEKMEVQFGSIAEKGSLTPEEAFNIGVQMGKEMKAKQEVQS